MSLIDDISIYFNLTPFNFGETSWLGNGDFGDAYLTESGHVIKMTRDVNEFATTAKLFADQKRRLENGESEEEVYENSIRIDNVFLTEKGDMVIIMEHLNTDGLEDIFNDIMNINPNEHIFDIDFDDYDIYNREELEDFINQIYQSALNFSKSAGVDYYCLDIQDSNIGFNQYGNAVLFDQRDKSRSNEHSEEIINELKSEGIIATINIKETNTPKTIKFKM